MLTNPLEYIQQNARGDFGLKICAKVKKGA